MIERAFFPSASYSIVLNLTFVKLCASTINRHLLRLFAFLHPNKLPFENSFRCGVFYWAVCLHDLCEFVCLFMCGFSCELVCKQGSFDFDTTQYARRFATHVITIEPILRSPRGALFKSCTSEKGSIFQLKQIDNI